VSILVASSDVEFPLVSVIIVNFNGQAFMKNCLVSVSKTAYENFEVLVVDNGSTDGSVKLVKSFIKQSTARIKLIVNPKNLGFAEGNNIGIGDSIGKYIAFLNNDTIVDPNWLQSMVALLEKDTQIACVQSLLLSKNGLKVDSYGGTIDIFGKAEDKVISMENLKLATNSKIEIFSACAASMVVRKSVLKEVGYFDPKFFAYFEDVDLCWRMRLHGYIVVLDLNSVVYHLRSATSKKFGRRLFNFHLYKNQLAMLIKNYELKSLVKTLPGIFSLYSLRVLNGLIRNDAHLSIAVLKALSWNVKNFPYLFRQRCYIQTCLRRVGDDQILKIMEKRPKHLFSSS
jgi:GT2 family glycosyltransferase